MIAFHLQTAAAPAPDLARSCLTFLITWLPFLAIVGVWLYVMRRMGYFSKRSGYIKRSEDHMDRVEQTLTKIEEHLRKIAERDVPK
jgi:ATP-dependent Zn protease